MNEKIMVEAATWFGEPTLNRETAGDAADGQRDEPRVPRVRKYLCIAGIVGAVIGFCEHQGAGGWSGSGRAGAGGGDRFGRGLAAQAGGSRARGAHYSSLQNKFSTTPLADRLLHVLDLRHGPLLPGLTSRAPPVHERPGARPGTRQPGRVQDGRPVPDEDALGVRQGRIYLQGLDEPRSFLRYQNDYWRINVVGSAPNEYRCSRVPTRAGGSGPGRARCWRWSTSPP